MIGYIGECFPLGFSDSDLEITCSLELEKVIKNNIDYFLNKTNIPVDVFENYIDRGIGLHKLFLDNKLEGFLCEAVIPLPKLVCVEKGLIYTDIFEYEYPDIFLATNYGDIKAKLEELAEKILSFYIMSNIRDQIHFAFLKLNKIYKDKIDIYIQKTPETIDEITVCIHYLTELSDEDKQEISKVVSDIKEKYFRFYNYRIDNKDIKIKKDVFLNNYESMNNYTQDEFGVKFGAGYSGIV